MRKRRRFRQITSLEERLAQEAAQLRKQAQIQRLTELFE